MNGNKSHEEPEPETFDTELAYTVTVKNSFNTLENLEDELGKEVIHDKPEIDPVDEEEKTESKSKSASSSGQWGLVKAGHRASTDQNFRNLWKCEFCEQTYNRQNTFDQVYHTLGHKNEP